MKFVIKFRLVIKIIINNFWFSEFLGFLLKFGGRSVVIFGNVSFVKIGCREVSWERRRLYSYFREV